MPLLTKADLQRLAIHYEDGYAIVPRRMHPKGAVVSPKFYVPRQEARASLDALPDSLRKEHKVVKARRILICAKESNG